MIEYKLAWRDKEYGFIGEAPAWAKLGDHYKSLQTTNTEYMAFNRALTWGQFLDSELAEFGATRYRDYDHLDRPWIAQFPDQKSLVHFLLVWS
jgi:hypothetical protein